MRRTSRSTADRRRLGAALSPVAVAATGRRGPRRRDPAAAPAPAAAPVDAADDRRTARPTRPRPSRRSRRATSCRPTSRAPSTPKQPTLIFFYDSTQNTSKADRKIIDAVRTENRGARRPRHLRHRQVRGDVAAREPSPSTRRSPTIPNATQAVQLAKALGVIVDALHRHHRRPGLHHLASSAAWSTRPSSSARCCAPHDRGAKHAVALRRERRPRRAQPPPRWPPACAHERSTSSSGRTPRSARAPGCGARSTPTRCLR